MKPEAHPIPVAGVRRGRRGAILLLILWAVIMLSAILVKVYGLLSLDVEQATVENRTVRARLLAESGLALARHPEIERDSPLLKYEEDGGNASREVVFTSEGARLNLNALLAKDDDITLVRLLNSWGMKLEEAETVRDRMADWVDGDGLTRIDGAERDAYLEAGLAAYPLNRPFQTIEEVREVLGVAELLDEAHPGWEDSFSLHAQGGLDLQDAPAELIEVVCGVTPGEAERFVRTRQGRDRTDGTDDDIKFESADQALRVLGVGAEEAEGLKGAVTVGGKLFRFESTGVVGGRKVTIYEIANRGTDSRQTVSRWEHLGP
ncbi:MAG: type II secretion system protein GspK [Candidatus Methylacidiphilales bacterium]|nr:type II secretion system protein GspK [Candidatus Methylacidiphilales bacterium]